MKIFFCYAREDEPLLNELKIYLEPLRRQGLIEMWYDRDISAGADWVKVIDNHLDTAQIILLLVSQYFMASDYCYGVELKQAMERHDRREAVVIPIILRPVYFQGAPFSKLQVLPKDAKPVKSWLDQDEAFFNVAEGIRREVERLSRKPIVIPEVSNSVNPKVTTSKPPIEATDRVVVVPARIALQEYLKYSAYICQPNRSFQPCNHMAFYTQNKIDRHIPSILGHIEAITRDEIETRSDLSEIDRTRLRTLLQKMDTARSEEWSKMRSKIVFLSPSDSPDTLVLPYDIVNNLTSESGREIAFTQGQRYVSLSRLQKGPKTTSELIEEFGKSEEAISAKSNSGNNMTYYVYDDLPTNSAKLHVSSCSYCNNGKGFQPNVTGMNTKWHGPFNTLQEAEEIAVGTGRKYIDKCKVCNPK